MGAEQMKKYRVFASVNHRPISLVVDAYVPRGARFAALEMLRYDYNITLKDNVQIISVVPLKEL